MGIFGALTTAVTGLRAQSYALENISGNIANSQTVGYKRIDTSFADLMRDGTPTQQNAGAVIGFSRGTNSVQGDIQNATLGTFMAINGDGYFSVVKPGGFSDGNPIFDGVDYFTRRGDFALDKNGYLINGAGYYLKAQNVDPLTGNLIGSAATPIRFQNDFIAAKQTSTIEYRLNLATYPRTGNADPDVPQSELLRPVDFTVDPTVAGTGTVVGNDVNTFIRNSISGGSVTAYDANGAPVAVQFRWAKIESSKYGGTDTWNLFYQTDSDATGGATAWQNVGVNYTFGANGIMTPPQANVTVPNLTVDGVNIGSINLAHTATGLTQFADANGNAAVNQLQQDGYQAGDLVGLEIGDGGRVVASYSNGKTQEVARIPLYSFNGDDGLKRLDGGAFLVTSDSGPPIPDADGNILGKALEGSNTDVADEFTKLIVTQQAYAANTRVVTSSNQMLQEVLNMVR